MPPTKQRSKFEEFATRFGYYFIGVAIGLVMLGVFSRLRQAERQQQAAPPAAVSPAGEPAPASPTP